DYESALSEAAALAMIDYTCDTEDAGKRELYQRFSGDILPRAEELSVALAKRLVALGWAPKGMELPVRRFRAQIEIFREANVPLLAQGEKLGSEYQAIVGGFTAEWEGGQLPIPQLAPFLKDLDRGVRERAFRASTAPYIAARGQLAAIFDQQYALRQQVAKNAGFPDYEKYAFASKQRFDYTPDDCRRWHDAVEAAVLPAVERIHAARRKRLGLDRLRPWDMEVDPLGRAALKPFTTDQQLIATTEQVFVMVDAELGVEFTTMRQEGLLDLGSRKGKAPGGYCETLHERGRPFIFMNAAGTMEDVMTLLHESGHAFHAFSSHALPLLWQRNPTMEQAELASMGMELLAFDGLRRSRGGFFDEAEWGRARREHLEDVLFTLPHVSSVDALQSWIYTSGQGHDAAARDAEWCRLRSRFDQGADWTGLEAERVGRWYRQLHIFLYPFYYIEYGLAQLGAIQLWLNARRDHPAALAAYRRALALGGTVTLPQMYQAAGVELVFDRGRMAELVAAVEEELARLPE
ncbi:MAG: M3 family oligoendopeptidase, partial [Gemmatimonadota bacterium]